MSDTVFELNGTALTVKPVGELDSMTSPVFEAELRERLPGVTDVIIDFAEVTYISSAGLRVILNAERIMEERDGEVRLIHVREHIREIFSLVGFMEVVKVE